MRAPRPIATFHPAWGGAIMGTAVLVPLALARPGRIPDGLARALAAVALAVAIGVAVLVLGAYLWRAATFRSAMAADLADPVVGPLLGTGPGGVLVLAGAIAVFGEPPTLTSALGITTAMLGGVGAILALAVGVSWAAIVAHAAPMPLSAVTGTWFLPPVVAVLVPLPLAPLAGVAGPELRAGLLALSLAFWGAGMLLFLLVAGLVVARLALAGPTPPKLASALWIAIAPPSAGGVALLRLADTAGAAARPATWVATMLLGFALWWAAFAVVVLVRQVRAGLRWTPAWWGFTFPVGALALLTALTADRWDFAGLHILAGLLALGALSVWAVVAGHTWRSVRAGTAWER